MNIIRKNSSAPCHSLGFRVVPFQPTVSSSGAAHPFNLKIEGLLGGYHRLSVVNTKNILTSNTYSHDLTKNVTELYKTDGHIASTYDYSPYGAATAVGIDQPLQWSSEYHDAELALTYYNYRHYNPTDGRWINRDPIQENGGVNLYGFVKNCPVFNMDYLGQEDETCPCLHIVLATVLRTSDKRTRVGGKSLVKQAAKAAAVELLEEIVEKTVSSVAVFGIFGEIALAEGRYIDILYAYRCIKLDTDWTIVAETAEGPGALSDGSFFAAEQIDAAQRAIALKMQEIQTKVKKICQCEE